MKKLNAQLKNLSNEIKPDREWQARSRDILLSQANRGAAAKEAYWFDFIESVWAQKFLIQATRPLSVVIVAVAVLFGGSVFSLRAADQTKPGDPLYIAKILSERTQFALTFNNTEKAKLNLSFAANRAQELKDVDSLPATEQDKQTKVRELTSELNVELAEAETRIKRIVTERPLPKQEAAKSEAAKPAVAQISDIKTPTTVKSANIEKSNTGLDYYDPRQAVLEEAKASLEKKDYTATVEHLKILTEAIEEPEKLEAKATSTESSEADKATSTDKKE